MANFGVSGPNASSTGPKTAVTVIGSTSVRPEMIAIVVGACETPADYAANWTIRAFTATGTAGSSPTPFALDQTNPKAAGCTAGITHSAEPTWATGSFLDWGMHHRSTFQWHCMDGREFKAPAASNNGLGATMVTASTALVQRCTVHFRE